jgi:uncharacterized RDD family membrane protein YckC
VHLRKFHPAQAGFFLPSNNALPAKAADALPPSSELPPASDPEQLRIAGLTGVDIDLTIAGPGSRSYAFLEDWLIRVLVALAWFSFALFLVRAEGVHANLGYLGGLPALAIYLLYHPLLEMLTQGRTPGMRHAGVRLVTRSGGTPGIAALLIRNVFRLIDMLPSFYLLGLACCFLTRERVRIGDLAAGTLLVVDAPGRLPTSALAAVARGGLAPAAAELIEDLLQRWGSLDTQHRIALAHSVLARMQIPLDDVHGSADEQARQLRERLRSLLAERAAG